MLKTVIENKLCCRKSKKKKGKTGLIKGEAADQNLKKRSANMRENNGSNENSSIQGENAKVDR